MPRLALITRAFLLAGLSLAGCDPENPCVNGQRSCPCTPLHACDDGLVCNQNTCVEPHHTTLVVSAPGARACEVVFQEGSTVIAEATFDDDVRGSSARRGSRMSVAFISSADAELTGAGVRLLWLGNQRTPDVTVTESECFDRLGQSIVGGSVGIR